MSARLWCVIPARAGSKRLPGKNLRALNGKPMLAHSIDAARCSDCFEQIYVATEDPRIAEVAMAYGADVPLRVPAALCADDVASHQPCLHLLEHATAAQRDDVLVCLQPTSPLRCAQDIVAAISRVNEQHHDFVVSVTPIDPHYFHWAVVADDAGDWRMFFGDRFMRERSELPAAYRPNGSIKIGRIGRLHETGHFFGSSFGVIETPEWRSVHVGNEFEFRLCELLMEREVHGRVG